MNTTPSDDYINKLCLEHIKNMLYDKAAAAYYAIGICHFQCGIYNMRWFFREGLCRIILYGPTLKPHECMSHGEITDVLFFERNEYIMYRLFLICILKAVQEGDRASLNKAVDLLYHDHEGPPDDAEFWLLGDIAATFCKK